MALIQCHECGHNVSTEAEACPSCGAKPRPQLQTVKAPTRKLTIIEKVGIGVGVLIAIFFIFSDDQSKARQEEQARAQDQACRQDLQCWGDKHISTVSAYCKNDVEKLAKFSVKWTDSTFEPLFSRFSWLDQTRGTVKFFGDKAQFQNGFGAYQNVIYECDFDPVNKKVLFVNVTPGHL